MRIIGIDPGSRRTGYGIVEYHDGGCRYITSGRIRAEDKDFPTRLATIYTGICSLIAEYQPQAAAVEEVFVARNPQSALKLGQARGVAIAAAVAHKLTVHEYAARSVKLAIVGSGKAAKDQVQHMVKVMLGLSANPSEDAADALAIAMCHQHTTSSPILRAR